MQLNRRSTIICIVALWMAWGCTPEEPVDLLPQEAFTIYPETGTIGDTIRMRVTNLVPEQVDFYRVLFGETDSRIVDIKPNEISIIVPEPLKTGTSTIQIIGYNFRYSSRKPFVLTPPEIVSYDRCTLTEDTLTIAGKNFNPNWSWMEVTFNGELAKVIGGNRSSLQVITPVIAYPDAKAQIKLHMADYRIEGKEDVCIEDSWLMVSNDAPDFFVNFQGSFVIGSKAYFPIRKDDPLENELLVYETKNRSWTSKPMEVPLHPISTVIGNSRNGYIYNPSGNDNFFEYDPVTDTWEAKNNFPGINRDYPVMFAIGKYIFLGLGNDQNAPWEPNYADFYRYDPDQDKWERMADLDFGSYPPKLKMSCTVIGEKAIISGGAHSDGNFGVWMYHHDRNVWERKNDFPQAVNFSEGFTFNGNGFVTQGRQVWKYNLQNDSWDSVDAVGFAYRYRTFAFVVEGKPYIGGGDAVPPNAWGNPTRNVYRYDRPSFQ
jgi:hypothetical protein